MNKIDSLLKENQIIGFGEHSNPSNYANYQQAKRIFEISLAILGIGALAGAATSISVFCPFIIFPIGITYISVSSASALSSLALLSVISGIHYKRQQNAFFGVMNEINDKITNPPIKLNEYSECHAIACPDTPTSFMWKKKLIESAQHNIVLSGNYCGGESFDEILDTINTQLMDPAKPNLKVIVISSNRFITPSNRMRLEKLIDAFPDRFQLIESPDIWHVNPGLKKTTNHCKFLAIDYGQHFLLGGSGIEDKYAYSKGLDNGSDKSNTPMNGRLVEMILPKGFRDQDFVFASQDENGVGKRIYLETLKLALRWEGITKEVDSNAPDSPSSVAKSLLTAETKPFNAATQSSKLTIEKFNKDPNLVQDVSLKILCIGPEHTYNPFEEEIFNRIQQAQTRIVIDHMYFHPTNRILDALADAAKRGVQITLITNGYLDNNRSPVGHKAFAPRNQYNYYLLAKKIGPAHQDNLKVFEFSVEKTTLHKKVIVVDDYVIAGSSNLGYKSLVTMSDHEINFIAKNQEFADETVKILEVDKETQCSDTNEKKVHAIYISHPERRPSIEKITIAALHRVAAPLIG